MLKVEKKEGKKKIMSLAATLSPPFIEPLNIRIRTALPSLRVVYFSQNVLTDDGIDTDHKVET